ncbi:MAG: cbb3-type cytochrome oxidase assembly protein CcoS [Planctomycetota bacterium]
MSVLYLMIPLAILMATAALAGFIWSVKRGQLDDTDTPAVQPLAEDEEVFGESAEPDRSPP